MVTPKLKNALGIFLLSAFAITAISGLEKTFLGPYISGYPMITFLVSVGGVLLVYHYIMQ